jgi:hypothetical protein
MTQTLEEAITVLLKTVEDVHKLGGFNLQEAGVLIEISSFFLEYSKERSFGVKKAEELNRMFTNLTACLNIGLKKGYYEVLDDVVKVHRARDVLQRAMNEDLQKSATTGKDIASSDDMERVD